MIQSTGKRYEVAIAGGGFAGLALAIALRQALGGGFAVMVADPALRGLIPAAGDAHARIDMWPEALPYLVRLAATGEFQ